MADKTVATYEVLALGAVMMVAGSIVMAAIATKKENHTGYGRRS